MCHESKKKEKTINDFKCLKTSNDELANYKHRDKIILEKNDFSEAVNTVRRHTTNVVSSHAILHF